MDKQKIKLDLEMMDLAIKGCDPIGVIGAFTGAVDTIKTARIDDDISAKESEKLMKDFYDKLAGFRDHCVCINRDRGL